MPNFVEGAGSNTLCVWRYRILGVGHETAGLCVVRDVGAAVLDGPVMVAGRRPGLMDEYAQRSAISTNARAMFGATNFQIVERMADQFRASRRRTSSGLWALGMLYNSLADGQAFELFGGVDGEGLESLADQWLKRSPNSVTANVAYARIMYGIAWEKRGSGFVQELTWEQIDGYRQYLARARKQLEASRSFASVDPQWYTLAISIIREGGWQEADYQALVSEAVKREPYYYPTYFAMITYSGPRWGGSMKAVDDVIRFAVENTREREGSSFLARGYWVVADGQLGAQLYKQSKANWDELKPAFDKLIELYPVDWNRNAYARLACLAGDLTTGKELIRELGKNLDPSGWQYTKMLAPCTSGPVEPLVDKSPSVNFQLKDVSESLPALTP